MTSITYLGLTESRPNTPIAKQPEHLARRRLCAHLGLVESRLGCRALAGNRGDRMPCAAPCRAPEQAHELACSWLRGGCRDNPDRHSTGASRPLDLTRPVSVELAADFAHGALVAARLWISSPRTHESPSLPAPAPSTAVPCEACAWTHRQERQMSVPVPQEGLRRPFYRRLPIRTQRKDGLSSNGARRMPHAKNVYALPERVGPWTPGRRARPRPARTRGTEKTAIT